MIISRAVQGVGAAILAPSRLALLSTSASAVMVRVHGHGQSGLQSEIDYYTGAYEAR
jgi:hypothetical protein